MIALCRSCSQCTNSDVHFPSLTVQQTISFAAKARTPRMRLNNYDRVAFADELTDMLLTIFGLRYVLAQSAYALILEFNFDHHSSLGTHGIRLLEMRILEEYLAARRSVFRKSLAWNVRSER